MAGARPPAVFFGLMLRRLSRLLLESKRAMSVDWSAYVLELFAGTLVTPDEGVGFYVRHDLVPGAECLLAGALPDIRRVGVGS
jgi:hypothetical protein